MNEMIIMSIFGTRPQFIKVAAIDEAIKEYKKESKVKIKHILINTGQHYSYNMSSIFARDLFLKINYNLGVRKLKRKHQIIEMKKRLLRILPKFDPSIVFVYGDTNSTLAGALAVKKLGFMLAHIESGMRSHKRNMPEEINRIKTDNLSDFLFCVNREAKNNIKNEGIKSKVYIVGDVTFDYLIESMRSFAKKSAILNQLKLKPKRYVLFTIHRASNTGSINRIKKILSCLKLVEGYVIWPIHPRTEKLILKSKISIPKFIKIIKPVSYYDMLMLEKNARLILTDSGGVQKESYFFKIPCLTLRDETEWGETLRFNANQLVGFKQSKIKKALDNIVNNQVKFNRVKTFQDSKASIKIMHIVVEKIKKFNNLYDAE